MNLLTTELIKKTKPWNKRITLRDGLGLFLRIQPSNVRSWVLRLNINGRNSDITLGRWPEISLRMARQLARRKRKEFDLVPPKGFTLKDAFALWCNKKRRSIKSYKDEKRRLERYVIARIGNRQLDEITAPLLIRLTTHLADENKLPTLKRVLMRVREILDLAVIAGYIEHNPAMNLTKVFPAPKVTHMPSIHYEKLTDMLTKLYAVGSERQINQCLIALCLLLRPGEVAKLRWDWIENDILTIPAEEMKMNRIHRVPLTPYALNLLKEAKKLSRHKRSPFVFPSNRRGQHVSTQSLTKFFLHKMSINQTPHGFRSIGRSWMADRDFSYEASEACLAHVTGNAVTQAYQRSDYLVQRWSIMTAWNKYVKECAECAQKTQKFTVNTSFVTK